MRVSKIQKIIAVFLISSLFFSAPSLAGGLSLLQKIKYKEVYIMEPTGREIVALVNKFTDKVEYCWAIDKWIKPPPHIQHCYKNQRGIRSWVERRKRYR